jgi:hypothetical protein
MSHHVQPYESRVTYSPVDPQYLEKSLASSKCSIDSNKKIFAEEMEGSNREMTLARNEGLGCLFLTLKEQGHEIWVALLPMSRIGPGNGALEQGSGTHCCMLALPVNSYFLGSCFVGSLVLGV